MPNVRMRPLNARRASGVRTDPARIALILFIINELRGLAVAAATLRNAL